MPGKVVIYQLSVETNANGEMRVRQQAASGFSLDTIDGMIETLRRAESDTVKLLSDKMTDSE
jgi:hypothetical protein